MYIRSLYTVIKLIPTHKNLDHFPIELTLLTHMENSKGLFTHNYTNGIEQ